MSTVTAPTSDLMYFKSSAESNNNGENYIVYAFCDIPGYSKMGIYTGNIRQWCANGQYVHTGFKQVGLLDRKVVELRIGLYMIIKEMLIILLVFPSIKPTKSTNLMWFRTC